MNPIYLPKLNEITSTLSYNSERGQFLEKVLLNFLRNPSTEFDVKLEMKKIVDKELEETHKDVMNSPSSLIFEFPHESTEDYFKQQETLLKENS